MGVRNSLDLLALGEGQTSPQLDWALRLFGQTPEVSDAFFDDAAEILGHFRIVLQQAIEISSLQDEELAFG